MNDEEGLLIFFVGVAVGCLISFVAPRYLSVRQESPQPVNRVAAVNKEIIRWKDWKGRDREITIHREVRYVQ